MRLALPVLVVTASIAHADVWSEYGTTTRLRPVSQLVEAACDVDVTFHGAIVQVEQRQRLANPGPEALAATTDFTLPAGAQLIGVELQQAGARYVAALSVRAPLTSERVSSAAVLGADPAVVTALEPADNGRPRFRAIVQPIAADTDATLAIRWSRVADLQGGAMRLVLPARAGKPCRGTVHAKPGPGASVGRVRMAGVEVSARTFVLESADLPIEIELAWARTEPVVWTQTESLGDGLTAQAITIIAPVKKALSARRALFVIDGSRSMELVGRHHVKRLVHAIGAALPQTMSVEAIVYDRTPSRVLGAWQPVSSRALSAIETALSVRTAGNGSDTAAALALARQAIGDAGGSTMIILVTDGVLGDIDDRALAQALGGKGADLDLHAIVLAHGRMSLPNAEPVRVAIDQVGGSYVEVAVEQLDTALGSLDEYLRPAWLDLALDAGDLEIPRQLRAGAGVVVTRAVKRPHRVRLLARGTKPIVAGVAPSAPIAELALARLAADAVPGETLERLRIRHPAVDEDRALVVLSAQGKVAKNRRTVVAEGGPFTRMVEIADPPFAPEVRIRGAIGGGSAIDRDALKLLFRTHLQPAAFACYQKALGRAPKLAGTAKFRIEIGRGEMTRATVTGLGDATFDACLLDAAYKITPSMPNPDYNVDDRTIANYPLTFSVREDKPMVLPGDADSSSPLDIEAIRGGLPVKVKAGDTSTPLGDLEVAPTK